MAHGNSLRALVKYFDKLSADQIMEVNIPTGVPGLFTNLMTTSKQLNIIT